MELSDPAVDQDQPRHLLFFASHALVPPHDDLAHRGKIIHALDGADDELAILRLLHLTVFPYHHRGDRLRPLDMRYIEALDPAREVGQRERVLQRLLDRLDRWLHHAEALV